MSVTLHPDSRKGYASSSCRLKGFLCPKEQAGSCCEPLPACRLPCSCHAVPPPLYLEGNRLQSLLLLLMLSTSMCLSCYVLFFFFFQKSLWGDGPALNTCCER